MVIAGDLCQLSKPGNLVEDAYRQVRMQPNSLELGRGQRPLPRPDLIRHPDAAQVMDVAGASGQCHRVGVDPGGQRGVAGKPGHSSRMSKGEWAFQVDEVAQREEQRVQRLVIEPLMVIGRRSNAAARCIAGRRTGQDGFGMVHERVNYSGIELPAAPVAHHGHGPLDAVRAVVNLDHVGELSDAHLNRDRLTVGAVGRPPPSYRSNVNATAACTPGPRPIRSASRAAEVQCESITRESWPRALTKSVAIALSRCASGWARPTLLTRNRHVRQPGPIDQIRVMAYGDVVAEPPRVFVRVGMTADPHDQRRVVGAVPLLPAEPQSVGKPGRNQRRSEHVFGGLAETGIDRDRLCRQQLRTSRRLGCRRIWARRSIRPRRHRASLCPGDRPGVTYRNGAPDRTVTGRIEPLEVPRAHHEQAALRRPEAREVSLPAQRSDRSEVCFAQNRARMRHRP